MDNVFKLKLEGIGWVSNVKYPLWEDCLKVQYRAASYDNSEPNSSQLESFSNYMANKSAADDELKQKLLDYINLQNENLKDVAFDELVFFKNGNYALMCSTQWSEDGIAVLHSSKGIIVGPQFIISKPKINS